MPAVNWTDVRTRLQTLCDNISGISIVTTADCTELTLPFARVTQPRRSTKRVVTLGQVHHIARQFDIFLYVQEDCDPAKPTQYESAMDAAAEKLDTISDMLFANPTLKLTGEPNIGAKLQNEITDNIGTDTYNGRVYSVVVTSFIVEANRST